MSSRMLDEGFVSKEQFTPRTGSHHEDEMKGCLSSSQSKRKNVLDTSQIYNRYLVLHLVFDTTEHCLRLKIDRAISPEAIEWAVIDTVSSTFISSDLIVSFSATALYDTTTWNKNGTMMKSEIFFQES